MNIIRRTREASPLEGVRAVLIAVVLAVVTLGPAATWARQGAKYVARDAPWVGSTFWGRPCSGMEVTYGPFDYTERHLFPDSLELVEKYHFNSDVESLQRGQSGSALGDLDYTLRAWPNHHRALNSVIRARLASKSVDTYKKYPPAECYLQRAINFSPGDGMAHMLFAILHHRMGQLDDAYRLYLRAEELRPGDPQIDYNFGLLLFDQGNYEKARDHAKQAYAKNFPLQGLRNKLERSGFPLEP